MKLEPFVIDSSAASVGHCLGEFLQRKSESQHVILQIHVWECSLWGERRVTDRHLRTHVPRTRIHNSKQPEGRGRHRWSPQSMEFTQHG